MSNAIPTLAAGAPRTALGGGFCHKPANTATTTSSVVVPCSVANRETRSLLGRKFSLIGTRILPAKCLTKQPHRGTGEGMLIRHFLKSGAAAGAAGLHGGSGGHSRCLERVERLMHFDI
jgi:hypothetical protein